MSAPAEPAPVPFGAGMKSVFMGLILVTSYSAMVIDIIGILKVRGGENERSPAVIAALVAAILQAVWCAGYFIRSAKGFMYRASSTLGVMLVFFVWQIICIPIILVYNQRDHKAGYCSPSNDQQSNCDGAFGGVIGIGFAVAFLDLIYVGYLAMLVSGSRAAWSDELDNIPKRELPPAKNFNG